MPLNLKLGQTTTSASIHSLQSRAVQIAGEALCGDRVSCAKASLIRCRLWGLLNGLPPPPLLHSNVG